MSSLESELVGALVLDIPKTKPEDYPKYIWIVSKLATLNFLNYEEVCELETEFVEFQYWYKRGYPRPFQIELDRICERRKILLLENNPFAKKYYDNPITMCENEEINGYKLYDIEKVIIMSFEMFEKLAKLFNNTSNSNSSSSQEPETRRNFYEWYDHGGACSDWGKMDRHGSCFGGFWEYPEGSNEKENAFRLSWEDNFQGLWELPYPKELIKETVDIGCGNRHESVRYSNFLCEWVKRMTQVVYE